MAAERERSPVRSRDGIYFFVFCLFGWLCFYTQLDIGIFAYIPSTSFSSNLSLHNLLFLNNSLLHQQ